MMTALKRILCLQLMAMTFIAISASNTVSLSSTSGHPNEEVSVSVALSNSDAVSAVEIEIPLGEHLSYVDESCTLNTTRSKGHQVTACETEHTLKIYIFSLSLSNLRGNTGELLTFKLLLGSEPANYVLTPQVLLSNAAGTKIESTVETNGNVTIFAPKINVATPQINFGHVPIRSTYTRTLLLQNTGNELLTVSNITTENGELNITPSTTTIEAGESKSITITYSPLLRTPFNAKVEIESDATNAKIYKKWQSAEIVADPYSVNELRVLYSEGIGDEIVTVVLKMNNMEPIVAMQANFTLPDALQYVEGSAQLCSRGAKHMITGTLKDKELTLAAFSLNNTPFSGEDGDLLSFDVRLNGSSGTYWLKPTTAILSNAQMENMTSAMYGNYVRIRSPQVVGNSTLTFERAPVTNPATATYSVSNYGSATLIIDRVTFLAEGYSVLTPLPLQVGIGETAQITVQYTPSVEGEFGTTMNIYSNDPNNRLKQVTLSGEIYEPNALEIEGKSLENGNYQLKVALNNYSDIVAVQFDLHLPATLEVSDEEDVAKTSRLRNHFVNSYPMGNNIWRVLVLSMSNQLIKGHEGELFTLELIKTGKYSGEQLTIDNLVISSAKGQNKSSQESVSLTLKQTVAMPTFSRAEGAIVAGTTVTLDCATAGANIWVCEAADLGEAEPTAENIVAYGYKTSSITVNASAKYYAVAIDEENNSSEVAEVTYTVILGAPVILSFEDWDFEGAKEPIWESLYHTQNCHFSDAVVTFEWASRQASTITNCPVSTGWPVVVMLNDWSKEIEGISANFEQWNSKAQTVVVSTSTDGINYASQPISTNNFVLDVAKLPAGTKAIKFTFSSNENEIGIRNVALYVKDDENYNTTSETVTISDKGVNSFSSHNVLDFSGVDGLEAYQAGSVEAGVVNMVKVTGSVAAGTGLLLRGDANSQHSIPVAANGNTLSRNLLKPFYNGQKISVSYAGNLGQAQYDNNFYVFGALNSDLNTVGFIRLTSSTDVNLENGTGRNLAYLQSATNYVESGSNAKGMIIKWNVDLTGVEDLTVAPESNDDAIYNVLGQKVGADYKGIVIKNGKKYINK